MLATKGLPKRGQDSRNTSFFNELGYNIESFLCILANSILSLEEVSRVSRKVVKSEE